MNEHEGRKGAMKARVSGKYCDDVQARSHHTRNVVLDAHGNPVVDVLDQGVGHIRETGKAEQTEYPGSSPVQIIPVSAVVLEVVRK